MSLQGKSLCILTPMYGGNLSLNYHNAFVQLVLLCRDLKIDVGWTNTWNESLISRGRNRMADNFLKNFNSTHAIFIDADIGFDPQDVIAMLEMDADIVGVPCSKKSIRWDRVQSAVARRVLTWAAQEKKNGHNVDEQLDAYKRSGAAIDPALFPNIAGDFVLNFKPWEGDKQIQFDQPEEMKHLGTGMLMIKRTVFERFKKAYPDRWYEPKCEPSANPGPIHDFFRVGVNPESREYDSEDYWFCHDCIALGYKVLMMPGVRTTHMGTFTYVGDLPMALAHTGELF